MEKFDAFFAPLGFLASLIIIGFLVAFIAEARCTQAFNKALDNGVEPLEEGIYVVPFSKKKDLLVVPSLWAYNRRTLFRPFKKGEMMTLVSLGGLHKPWDKASKNQREAFSVALANGAQPSEGGVYVLPYNVYAARRSLVVIPLKTSIKDGKKVRCISDTPDEFYFWEIPQDDKLLALITNEGGVIRF